MSRGPLYLTGKQRSMRLMSRGPLYLKREQRSLRLKSRGLLYLTTDQRSLRLMSRGPLYSGQGQVRQKVNEKAEISRLADIIMAQRWRFILRSGSTNDCRVVTNLTSVTKGSIESPDAWRRLVEEERDGFWWESCAGAAGRRHTGREGGREGGRGGGGGSTCATCAPTGVRDAF